jgi:predicted dehydrogenase
MVEQTTHIFDLARVLVGEATKVYGAAERTPRAGFPNADICDVSLATVHFMTGALGNFASTCLLNWPHRIGLHLFSEGMAIELTEFELMVDTGQGRPIQKAQGDPFVREDRDFVDAVQGKPNKIRAPYTEALRTHHLVMTAIRSAEQGQPLEIQPEAVNV